MKQTIQNTGIVNCEYEIINYKETSLCIYNIEVIDQFHGFNKTYLGITQNNTLQKFLKFPDMKNLAQLEKTASYFKYYLLPTTTFNKLLEEQGNTSLYFKDAIASNQIVDYYNTVEKIKNSELKIFTILKEISIEAYSFFNADFELEYQPVFLSLSNKHNANSYIITSDNMWNKEDMPYMQYSFTSTHLQNKEMFFNHLISLQQKEKLFNQDSFNQFLKLYITNPVHSSISSLYKNELSSLLTSDSEDLFYLNNLTFPSIKIKNLSQFQEAYTVANEINEIEKYGDITEITTILLLQMNSIYEKLHINFEVFCDNYFKDNLETSSGIKKYFLNKNLNNDLLENSSKNTVKNKI